VGVLEEYLRYLCCRDKASVVYMYVIALKMTEPKIYALEPWLKIKHSALLAKKIS
jgi:hypothetical protein